MEKQEFKVGDIVVYNDHEYDDLGFKDYYPPFGTKGEITGICDDGDFRVKWAENTTKGNGRWYCSALKVKKYESEGERKMKFKLGQKVRFTSEGAHINAPFHFPLVGTTGIISKIDEKDCEYPLEIEWEKGSTSLDDIWWCAESMVELVEELKPDDDKPLELKLSKFEENEYVRVVPFNGITPEGFMVSSIYKVVAVSLSPNGDQVYLVIDETETGYYISECFLEALPKECMDNLVEVTPEPIIDNVNSPSHYTSGGIETIDYMEAKLTPEEFKGYLKGNVIKYTSRGGKKLDELEDFKKAQWYLNRLIKKLEEK